MALHLQCSFLCVIVYLYLQGAVSQVQLNISPSEVVLTSSSPVSTTFQCTISSCTSVTRIRAIQIRSKEETETSSVLLAIVQNTSPTIPGLGLYAGRGSSVSGGIDTNTPISSTLTLTMPTEDIFCGDKGYYECVLVYEDAKGIVHAEKNNKTLSMYVCDRGNAVAAPELLLTAESLGPTAAAANVTETLLTYKTGIGVIYTVIHNHALPSGVFLYARQNGQLIQGTATDEADVNVGDMVQFTCTASIGSNNSTRIRWKRTSEIGIVDNFITYNPPQGSYDDGTPTSVTRGCTYSRTATLSYTVTYCDIGRLNNLAFQCYISVVPPGQNTYEKNPPTFYINPVAGNTVTATIPTVTETCSGCPLGLAVGITIGTLLFIEGVVGAVIYYIINRRKYLTNSSTAGPNVYEIPNRRAFETEHVYNQDIFTQRPTNTGCSG